MASCAPGLHFLALMGKFGPWKTALAKRWTSVVRFGTSKSDCSSVWSLKSLLSGVCMPNLMHVEPNDLQEADLDAMIRVMQAAVLDMADQDLQAWKDNVGHNNLWYAGWEQVTARFFPVVSKQKGKHQLSVSNSQEELHCKFLKAHAVGMMLVKLPVARDLTVYHEATRAAMKLLPTIRMPSSSPDTNYSLPWLIRSRIMAHAPKSAEP